MKTMIGVLTFTAILCVGVLSAGVAQAALVQYWAFEETTGLTASNEVTGGNVGTLVNFAGTEWSTDTPTAAGHSNGSLAFSSASNRHVNGGQLGLESTTGSGTATVAFWMKPTLSLADTRLWGHLNVTTPPHLFGAPRLETNGTLQAWPGTTWQDISPVGAITAGQWHHVAFTWAGDNLVSYVNGSPVGGLTIPFHFNQDTFGNPVDFGIGAKYINVYGQSFDGVMDDVAVWNQALTSTQVGILAGGAAPSDLHAGTLPFYENFSGTAPDFAFGGGDFGGGGGGFSVGSGTLNLSSGSGTQAAAVQVTDDLSATPIRMSMTFSASAFSSNSDIGFAAFADTADFAVFVDEHYLADLKPNGLMRILRVNQPGTVVTTIATGDFGTFSTSETYDLTFETTLLAGGSLGLELTIDAPSISLFSISGIDTSPLSGSFFGVRTRESGASTTATFDNFSINLPEPSTYALLGVGLFTLATFGRRRRRRGVQGLP